MSQTRLRALTFALCTIPEISTVAKTHNSRVWSWKHGADVFSREQVTAIESHVVQKLANLNSLAAPALACAS
jgi:hypothetical protein